MAWLGPVGLNISKKAFHQEYIEIEVAERLIDDDLEFDIFDVESLLQVTVHALSNQYEFFARFFNGVVVGISGAEFVQCIYAKFLAYPMPTVNGLVCDGLSARLWVLNRDLGKRLLDGKCIPFETPVHKVWARLDTIKAVASCF